MLANLKIICQFHAHSVHQNSVEIGLCFAGTTGSTCLILLLKKNYWTSSQVRQHLLPYYCIESQIFWAEIYRGRLLTLITGNSSRLLCIRFSADLTMYWFPVCHFRCMKFKPLVIWISNKSFLCY
jgi:hypothetical protein